MSLQETVPVTILNDPQQPENSHYLNSTAIVISHLKLSSFLFHGYLNIFLSRILAIKSSLNLCVE